MKYKEQVSRNIDSIEVLLKKIDYNIKMNVDKKETITYINNLQNSINEIKSFISIEIDQW